MMRCHRSFGPLAAALGLACASFTTAADAPLTVYVGTYTDGTSKGIYRFSLDPESGKASAPVLAGEAKNPSFLALHPSGRFLYAVSEVDEFGGAKTGSVVAFAVDPKSGDLTKLNEVASEGGAPCHLVVDKAGRNVLVANYGGGTVAVLPVGADGRLEKASSVRTHEGKGPNAQRQDKPHAHGIYLDAAERFALAPDLGADRVFVYGYDAAKHALTPHGAGVLEPGSGPRHLSFHPSGRYAYVINELRSTVSAFGYDATKGELSPLQTLSALPDGFKGTSYTAEIEVAPDGRFVYGSNRGDDSLAVFQVDAASGRLTAVGHVPLGGSWPRHFKLDPSGRVLIAAHQRGNTIGFFRLDPKTGQPSPLGATLAVDKPVCVLPVPPRR
jgi:6-phosphogluconolactonase